MPTNLLECHDKNPILPFKKNNNNFLKKQATFMRKKHLFSIVSSLTIFCLLSSLAQARWATLKDAPAEIEFSTSDIIVDKDGKTEEVIEKQIKILNETGRNLFGVERIHF